MKEEVVGEEEEEEEEEEKVVVEGEEQQGTMDPMIKTHPRKAEKASRREAGGRPGSSSKMRG